MKRQTLGLRERKARKRHRRAAVSSFSGGTAVGPLKFGRKHSKRIWRRIDRLAVAESEKRATGAPETN